MSGFGSELLGRAVLIALLMSPLAVTPTMASDIDAALAPAGTLRAGGMMARLESFKEGTDGVIEARLSFQNMSMTSSASVALEKARDSIARLTNGRGKSYRLMKLSADNGMAIGDGAVVPPGSSVFLTATFAPDGVAKGQQPFALALPVHMTWSPAPLSATRTSTFEINFRGLHRDVSLRAPGQSATDRTTAPVASDATAPPPPQAAPVTPVQMAALPPPSVSVHGPEVSPSTFDDDLTPRVKASAAVREDARHYLFAVGVEQYDDAPAVPYADRSTKLMAELLRKRYGVPEDNAMVLTGNDATGMKIIGRLNSLVQRLRPGDTLYFYYAGHGLAARDGSTVYVVPKDAVPGAYEVEMLSLAALLKRFDVSAASHVVAFVDTCFSGRVGSNESLFPGVGPLVPTPVTESPAHDSKTTLFLAGQAYQFANAYPEHGHRLFSYYLMQGLLKGLDEPQALQDYVAKEVRRVSAKRGAEFLQEPQLQGPARSLADAAPRKPRKVY